VNGSSANDDIWAAVSLDGGLNFGAPIAIEDPMGLEDVGDVDDTHVFVDGMTVAVYYQDNEFSGFDSPCLMLSQDGGITWGAEQSVSPATDLTAGAGATYIDCAVSGLDVYYCYTSDWNATSLGAVPGNGDNSGTRQLYISVSHDGGINWTYDIDLDPGRANNECSLGASGDKVFVACQRNPFGGNDMAYWVSLDGGATFTMHVVANSLGFDIDQSAKRSGPTFAFDGGTQTGMSVVGFNITGMNETYVCGVRAPGLALGSPSAGTSSFDITGVFQPSAASVFAIFLSATGTTPDLRLDGQILNLAVDSVTLATVGTFTGPILNDGSGTSLPFPALTGPVGLWAAAVTIDLSSLRIQLSDPIAL
jgi:hypothetical protein